MEKPRANSSQRSLVRYQVGDQAQIQIHVLQRGVGHHQNFVEDLQKKILRPVDDAATVDLEKGFILSHAEVSAPREDNPGDFHNGRTRGGYLFLPLSWTLSLSISFCRLWFCVWRLAICMFKSAIWLCKVEASPRSLLTSPFNLSLSAERSAISLFSFSFSSFSPGPQPPEKSREVAKKYRYGQENDSLKIHLLHHVYASRG